MSLGSSKQQWILGNTTVSTNSWVQYSSTLSNARTYLVGIDPSDNINTYQLINANAKTAAFGNVTYNSLSRGPFNVLNANLDLSNQGIVSDTLGNVWMTAIQNVAGPSANIWIAKYNKDRKSTRLNSSH